VLNNGADFAFPSRTIYHEFGENGLNVNSGKTNSL